MGEFFANLRSGVQFPQVVMNQGPLPGSGGLPRPLHDTADSRINYNSSLLGNITPYAYGEPGYLSSQTAYLNIPHKIQKHIPLVFLPEPRKGATDFFDLSHAVDDGDLVFTLRLARNSLFCTGKPHGESRKSGLTTRIDPLINLATVNYILSGIQLGVTEDNASGDLWSELLFNLDPRRFGRTLGMDGRDYTVNPLALSDIVYIVRHCIRPFGVARGSEKQGGQNEVGMGPSTWPVGAMLSITLDGKESNVLNLWHHLDMSAGDDLVLCLKLMPLRPYTLNHYFEGFKRKSWPVDSGRELYVWQLVPALANLDPPTVTEMDTMKLRMANLPSEMMRCLVPFPGRSVPYTAVVCEKIDETKPWQELGYWHIGRSQIMTGKYGVEEYWHNDQANSMRTNHLDITLQPFFMMPPQRRGKNLPAPVLCAGLSQLQPAAAPASSSPWTASLFLERLGDRRVKPRVAQPPRVPVTFEARARPAPPRPVSLSPAAVEVLDRYEPAVPEEPAGESLAVRDAEGDSDWAAGMLGIDTVAAAGPITTAGGAGGGVEDIGVMEDAGALAPPSSKRVAVGGRRKQGGAGKVVVEGSLLRADGTLESTGVSML